ncbi:hypothetical protein V8D89_000117 [Ganoderma adspersum]
MLSRTLAVLQSLVFPWNEGHYHPPSQPRPRKKRSGVDDPTVLTKFKFTHRPGGPPQFLPLSPSHHVPPVPPPFLPRKRHKALPSLDTEPPQVPQSFRRFSPSYTSKKSRFRALHFLLASFVPCAFRSSSVGVGWILGGQSETIRRKPFVHMFDPAHAATLQHLLPSLSSLVKLSVLARRLFYRPMQYPLLPKACIPQSSSLQRTGPVSSLQPPDPASSPSFSASFPPPTAATSPPMPRREPSPIPLLSELRSLVIAYPDPEDGLFSLGLHNLTHLSLCDHPRVYHRLVEDGRSLAAVPDRTWPAPLLSPEECLFILRRMDLSRLTSLELVYIAHQPGSDDDLLAYILHRYRGVRTEMRGIRVDHMHIAQLLSAATSLRTLRLNLDFHDDHQAYCNVSWERERWLPLFKTRGFEIVDLLQASCPHLEHVALLYHGESAATWAEFHPQRCAEPRFVLDYTKDHVDSEPYPRE